jgi:hypothetical protein
VANAVCGMPERGRRKWAAGWAEQSRLAYREAREKLQIIITVIKIICARSSAATQTQAGLVCLQRGRPIESADKLWQPIDEKHSKTMKRLLPDSSAC